jgi:hypothetical protein
MSSYTVIIILTFIAFVSLAALLLVPVYLFLRREERAGKAWTQKELARRWQREVPPSNGSSHETDAANA